jgi:hypothetical protein
MRGWNERRRDCLFIICCTHSLGILPLLQKQSWWAHIACVPRLRQRQSLWRPVLTVTKIGKKISSPCTHLLVRVQVNTVKADAAKPSDAAASTVAILDEVPVEVTTFFVTPEDGIIVQVL